MKLSAYCISVVLVFQSVMGCAKLPTKLEPGSTEPSPEELINSNSQCESFWADSDSATYTLKKPHLNLSVFLVEEDQSDPIKVVVAFSGQLGAKFRVDGDQIRFRYEYNDWLKAPAELISIQTQDWQELSRRKDRPKPLPQAIEDSIPFKQESKFQTGEQFTKNEIQVRAKIPFYKQNFEIEIPRIMIGSEDFAPKILKYKWNNRWTTSALTGC